MNIIMILVFSSALLIFMIYPAIKITDWIETKIPLPKQWHNPFLLGMVVILSLCVGLFLQYA